MKFLFKADAPGDNNYCQVDFFLVDIDAADLPKLIKIAATCQRALKRVTSGWGSVHLPDDHIRWDAIEASPTFDDPELLGDTGCIRLPDDFELKAGHEAIRTDGQSVNIHLDGDIWLESTVGGDCMEAQMPDLATLEAMPITTLEDLFATT